MKREIDRGSIALVAREADRTVRVRNWRSLLLVIAAVAAALATACGGSGSTTPKPT